MFSTTFSEWVIYFVIYSFIGWLCEVVYCSVLSRKMVKRGFLAGPYCPIYGLGAVTLIIFLTPLAKSVVSMPIFFAFAVVFTSALEYFTSWLLETMFGMKLWDYSNRRFNINGRVCLFNSTLFGIMGIVLMYLIHPHIIDIVSKFSHSVKIAIASLSISIMLADLVTTLNGMYKLEHKIASIFRLLKELAKHHSDLHWNRDKSVKENIEYLTDTAAKTGDNEIKETVQQIKNLLQKDITGMRILSTFTSVRHKSMQEQLEIAKQAFDEKRISFKRIWSEIRNKLRAHFDSKSEYKKENNTVSFAHGLNFYKLVWIFFIASFVGFVVETLWCIVTRHTIESRQGLIYGPFSQIYGLGAVFMTVTLRRFATKNDRWIFLGGMVIGGVFEYICSVFQEKLFGSISWNYESQRLSLDGRTSLLYMFFWGTLCVVFIKNIYPKLSSFVEKIPNKQGVVFSWIIIMFMVFDVFISSVAVHRWSKRITGVPAENSFQEFLDSHYNDEYMENIYPNMMFLSENQK